MQCNRTNHTTSSDDSRSSWKIGNWRWGDFATTGRYTGSSTETVPTNANANAALVVPSNNGGTAPPSSPILPTAILSSSSSSSLPPSSSLLPSNVASSTSETTTLWNETNNAASAIPDSIVSSSSSSFPDFDGSAATSSSSDSTSTTTGCRGWKTGDWCWLKEEKQEDVREEQEETVVENVNVNVKEEQEQETAVASPSTADKPVVPTIHSTRTRTNNPKRNRRTAKRKAAAASSCSTSTDDDTSDEDYYEEQDITEDCEENYEFSNVNDCSNSEIIRGPRTKKAIKNSRQDIYDKMWEEMYLAILEYKTQHGNTLVPTRYDKNHQLGNWLSKQRQMSSKKQLSNNRVFRL